MIPIPENAPAVDMRGVKRRFGAAPVLRGVDLAVESGECIAMFGPNGAGKSTLLRTLAGLLRADSGSVHLFGLPLPADNVLRARIGYLGHDAFLYRDLDARENLAYYGRLYGVKDPSRAEKLLLEVGLAGVGPRRVAGYSRGMIQRLGLARALLHEPELLLLDEPLTGLDPEGAAVLTGMLRSLARSGVTMMMATHDIDRALESATRAIILGRGRVAWDSGPGSAPDAATMTLRYGEAVAAH